jgi:hypothetical protein
MVKGILKLAQKIKGRLQKFSPSLSFYLVNKGHFLIHYHHRLNMELDLQSLFRLLCTAVLIG